MSAHVILLFEPDRASNQSEHSLAAELKRAGYDVIETCVINIAAALLFISRRVEAVVIDTASERVNAEIAKNVSALRPGLPLLRTTGPEKMATSYRQAVHKSGVVISTLNALLSRGDA